MTLFAQANYEGFRSAYIQILASGTAFLRPTALVSGMKSVETAPAQETWAWI